MPSLLTICSKPQSLAFLQGEADGHVPRATRRPALIELYSAYSSPHGMNWTKAGTTHQFGSSAQIGMGAENTAGFNMDFDYVRVYRLKE